MINLQSTEFQNTQKIKVNKKRCGRLAYFTEMLL